MKYEMEQRVQAVYDETGTGNPLLEAIPEQLLRGEFERRMEFRPPYPVGTERMTLAARKQNLAALTTIFIPLDYMYSVYDTICRMIRATYLTQTTKETVRRVNHVFMRGEASSCFSTQAEAGALLGTAGTGKSSCVRRCLCLIPQVIEHSEYGGETFYCKQVTHLLVECPSDCSIKTLAFNIVQALDYAIGTSHLDYMMRLRSVASSAVSTFLKTLCLTYHVGIIVIDEIQNVVETARRSNRVKPLVKFLVELTNDTSTSIFFVGTPLAEAVFTAEEHLRRRTRGLRIIPFKADGAYRRFLGQIWPYQFTVKQAELNDKLANKIYDYSGGIPDYIIKIIQEAQSQAIGRGEEKMDAGSIQRAVEALSIQPPSHFDSGISLSDFTLDGGAYEREETVAERIPRFFATSRGRRAEERDERDIIQWYKTGELKTRLRENKMLEELPIC